MSASHAGNPADEGLSREVYLVAAVVIVGVIMSILDTTIVNVALEVLSRELNASLNTIQWVSTGYLLALATVIPMTGWMSERFGAKRVYMVSVALFGFRPYRDSHASGMPSRSESAGAVPPAIVP